MTRVTLQTFLDGRWHDAGEVEFRNPDAGVGSAASLDYDLDYWARHGAAAGTDGDVVDLRALSVAYPLDLAHHRLERWPALLLDLIPQGNMRRKMAAERGWRDDDGRLDHALLLRGGGSPVGNVRIKEAWEADRERFASYRLPGVTEAEMLRLDDNFLAAWEQAGLSAAGSEGVQGEWPKILMTQDADGLWYPDPLVPDERARDHVLVKRTKVEAGIAPLVLASEPGYLEVARAFGLRVARPIRAGERVIVIPRFDRAIGPNGTLRLGQESVVSAIGVSEWGHAGTHEAYLAMLRRVCADPEREVVEYVLRDLLNMAMGNPDNHGRNTALRKGPPATPDAMGEIALTPLFDFAPMRRALEGGRATRWSSATTADANPDWVAIAEEACGPDIRPDRLLEELRSREGFVRELPARARAAGVPAEIVEASITRHEELADGLAAIPAAGHRP